MKELPGVTWLVQGGLEFPPAGARGHAASHSLCGHRAPDESSPCSCFRCLEDLCPLAAWPASFRQDQDLRSLLPTPHPKPARRVPRVGGSTCCWTRETLAHAARGSTLPEAGSGHSVSPLPRTNTALCTTGLRPSPTLLARLALPRGP